MVLRKGANRVQRWPSGSGVGVPRLVGEVFWGSCPLVGRPLLSSDLLWRKMQGECTLGEQHEQGRMGVSMRLGPGQVQRWNRLAMGTGGARLWRRIRTP